MHPFNMNYSVSRPQEFSKTNPILLSKQEPGRYSRGTDRVIMQMRQKAK